MSESVKNLDILFSNSDFVVVNKPAGWLSVYSREGVNEKRPVAGAYLEEILKTKIFPCHRLDVEVSGVLLFALSPKSHAVSQSWFQNSKIQKKYLALTSSLGSDNWPSNIPRKLLKDELVTHKNWTWKSKIERGKRRSFISERGLDAITEAEYLGVKDGFLKWKLSPITGRSHQLRLEMVQRGFAIVGDRLYGSKENWTDGIALQAVELNLAKIENRLGLPAQVVVKDFLFES